MFLGEGHGYPLQYSCLENPMDRNLVGYNPWGHKGLDMTKANEHACILFKEKKNHNI